MRCLTIVLFAGVAAAQSPVRTCESLTAVSLPNTTIEAAATEPASANRAAFCRVTAVTTHLPAGDHVRIFIGLPLTGWNGRFEGVGGGGFMGGNASGMLAPVAQGYAAGSTDTGHEGGSGSFALDSTGHLDWLLIRDNAYLGIHEMTVTAKALIDAFYGKPAQHAYFNGCSTGGRQGLSEAQRYPADYDGILSGAPATNWTKLHVEQMWGTVAMLAAKNPVAQCKLNAARDAAVAACDTADGVKDGVIENPRTCTYDPKQLIGTSTPCGDFTEADANVIRKIWEGPRRQDGSFLWYGLQRGGDFNGLSSTGGTPLEPRPNAITLEWWRYFLNQNPQWDYKNLTPALYEQYWDQSVEEFSAVLATDNPDLSAFRNHGGKLILWHGWADQLIYPEGTIDYYQRVQKQMGGAADTAKFARLFLAPGVGHCGGGSGPQPQGQFDAVVHWVEDGTAPDTLAASRRGTNGTTRTRPLCQFPLVAKYKGTGSTDDAANFACAAQ
ncbi:MAG TPA: tannase/feruloyl esterase family alpha/beta hydrolase [Bryobacteraceae bacterium]|jgi:feruloyl esterase|nr:tannase/feruloyl esterase family alpha/beta hydrolase [Bryobacteraceae bacterium]